MTHPSSPLLSRIAEARAAVMAELRKLIVGQEAPIDQILIAMFAGGHCMIQGPPGTAKTLTIVSIAKVMDLDFKRIQFTPDLMPSDISGTEILEADQITGHRVTKFVKGPVFCNLLMADEINRTPPKTQAALLEVMQEKQVTIGGTTHALPKPFYVMATQISMEQEHVSASGGAARPFYAVGSDGLSARRRRVPGRAALHRVPPSRT